MRKMLFGCGQGHTGSGRPCQHPRLVRHLAGALPVSMLEDKDGAGDHPFTDAPATAR